MLLYPAADFVCGKAVQGMSVNMPDMQLLGFSLVQELVNGVYATGTFQILMKNQYPFFRREFLKRYSFPGRPHQMEFPRRFFWRVTHDFVSQRGSVG